jgi:hypothetical protein
MRKRTNLKRVRKALGDHLDDYHRSLGEFVAIFSQVESTLVRSLWVLAHMEAPYAQAVLSGVRVDGAMGYINRIAEAEGWPKERKGDWQRIFTQLGLLNKLRNDLLHHGAAMFGRVWVVSIEKIVHHPARMREINFTPKILRAARADLSAIMTLLILLGGERVGIVVRANRASWMRKLRRGAWRYKQPPQADWVRMMDQLLQKRPRLLRSSQA